MRLARLARSASGAGGGGEGAIENSLFTWRGSIGIPKPFLFRFFSMDPQRPPNAQAKPRYPILRGTAERLLASESRCAEQETTLGPDDKKQKGAATDPPPPQPRQETVIYSRYRVQCPASRAQSAPSNSRSLVGIFSLSFRYSVSSRVTRPADQREKNKHEPAAVVQREISDSLFTQKDISINSTFSSFLARHGLTRYK